MRQTQFFAITAFALISAAACNKKSKQENNANVAGDRNSASAQKSPFAGVYSSRLEPVIREELAGALSYVVRGWTTGQVNKPSYNFIVDGAEREFEDKRHAQLRDNLKAARHVLSDPYLARKLLESMERRLNLQNPRGSYSEDSVELKAMMSAMADAGQRESLFVTDGVLVTVGWGEGDVAEVKGRDLPRGPKGLAENLAHEIAVKFASRVPY